MQLNASPKQGKIVKTDLSQRIKQVRVDSGLRQVFISEHTGITQDLLSRFENGIRTPTYAQLERMAKVYHMTVIEFLGGFDDALSDDERALIASLRNGDLAGALRILASVADCHLRTDDAAS